jgi:hypothetical protein
MLLFYFLITVVMLILTKYFFLLLILIILKAIFKILYINIRLNLANKTINTTKKITQIIS